MKSKLIIIIIVIALIGACILLYNQPGTEDNATIILSKSAYIKVPDDSNATSKVDGNGIFYYVSDVNITSSSNLSSSSSVEGMDKLKHSIIVKSKKIDENDIVIYEKNGTYSIFIKNTRYNDTLIIQSADKDLLLHSFMTLKFHDPTDDLKIDDLAIGDSSKVVNAVEKTQEAVKATDNYQTSSDYDWSYGDSSKSSQSSSKSYSTSSNVGGAASSAKFDFE